MQLKSNAMLRKEVLQGIYLSFQGKMRPGGQLRFEPSAWFDWWGYYS